MSNNEGVFAFQLLEAIEIAKKETEKTGKPHVVIKFNDEKFYVEPKGHLSKIILYDTSAD